MSDNGVISYPIFLLGKSVLFLKLFLKKKYFNENLTLPDNCLVFDLVAFFLFFSRAMLKVK